jgi:hypothetical protein
VLRDPARTLDLLPPDVRTAALQVNAPWATEELGLGPATDERSDYRATHADARGLIHRVEASRFRGGPFTFFSAELTLRFRALPLLRRGTGADDGGTFAIGDEVIPHRRFITVAIDRLDGAIDPSQPGSRLVLERRIRGMPRSALEPRGAEIRVRESWTVRERRDEVSLWTDNMNRSINLPSMEAGAGGIGAAAARGDHIALDYEISGVGHDFIGTQPGRQDDTHFSAVFATDMHRALRGIYQSSLSAAGEARLQAVLRREAERVEQMNATSRRLGAAARAQATASFQSAFALWQAGNFAAAIVGFVEGLTRDPANGFAHFYLADSYWKRAETTCCTFLPGVVRLRAHHLNLAARFAPPGSREAIEARAALRS